MSVLASHMNDPKHFLLGWASFAAAGIGGAILGYRRNKCDQLQRNLDDIEDTIARNKRMDDMGAKWEREHGSREVSKSIKLREEKIIGNLATTVLKDKVS